MRVCWAWSMLAVGVIIIAPIVSLWSTVGLIVFLSASVGLLVLTTPFMLPYLFTMIRMRRIISTVSYRSLRRHIARNNATFIGEGWSFWLSYTEVSKGKVISMSRSHSGIVACGESFVRVKSGTKIGDIQKYLHRYKKTFVDRSQFDDMTVGGALKTHGHGFCVRQWMAHSVLSVDIAVKGGDKLMRVSKGDPTLPGLLRSSETVILFATLSIIDDCWMVSHHCEWREATRIDLADYRRSDYRMIFVDANLVTVKWLGPLDNRTSLPPAPLRFEFIRQSLRIRRSHRSKTRLSAAHSVVASLDAFEALSIHWLRYINFELFVSVSFSLHRLVTFLQDYHKRHKGRTELRELKAAGKHTIALDVALHGSNKEDAIHTLLHALHDKFGVSRASQHAGKYQLRHAHPLKLVPFERIAS